MCLILYPLESIVNIQSIVGTTNPLVFDFDPCPLKTYWNASSSILRPSSISSADTVTRGATRKTPPIPGRLTTLQLNPHTMARSATACPISRPRRLRSSIRNNLNSLKKPATSHITDAPVLLLQFIETCAQLFSPFPCTLTDIVPHDDLKDLVAHSSSQRIVKMCCQPQKLRFRTSSLNFSCRAHSTQAATRNPTFCSSRVCPAQCRRAQMQTFAPSDRHLSVPRP